MTTIPETRYATTEDGVSIAYQIVGDGPVDLVLELEGWGNVEIMWELDALADLFERLSQFSRLVLHDRRGTGLSGGDPRFPTSRRGPGTSWRCSKRSGLAVRRLFGERTAGAALALFAASVSGSSRVARVVQGGRDTRWSPEYPWGMTPDEHVATEAASTRNGLGTKTLAREWLDARRTDTRR